MANKQAMQPRSALARLHPYTAGEREKGLVKLSSNENPLGPSPMAMVALHGVASDLSFYPDGGCAKLRGALARLWDVEPESIVVGNGSDEVLTLLAAAYISPVDKVIIPRYTFSQYEFSARLFGADPVFAPMPALEIDLDAVGDLVDADTRIVYLCSPNNPTGLYLAEEKLRAFLDGLPGAREGGGPIVVVDHAYGEYADVPDFGDATTWFRDYPNLVTLHTFSKIYGIAGLRVGYGVLSPELSHNLERARSPFNVSLAGQHAARAALDDSDFVARSLSLNAAGRALLAEHLGEWALPTQGNFVCVHTAVDAKEAVARIKSAGVTVRPLTSFGLPQHIRVTVGLEQHLRRVIDVVQQINRGR